MAIPQFHPVLCRGCGLYLVKKYGTCLCGTVRMQDVVIPPEWAKSSGFVEEVMQNVNNEN